MSLPSLKCLIGVEETWLDDELRQLPLFLVVACGSHSLKPNTDNVQATLLQSPPGNTVNLQLLRTEEPRLLKMVPIRHILPLHPSADNLAGTSTGKQYVVFIQGALKGKAGLLNKVEGDRAWVKISGDEELSEHSKYDLALSRNVKGKGKGKSKRK
jgi:hypothetical protein